MKLTIGKLIGLNRFINITPPLIVAPALGFDKLELSFFLNMAFIASGLTTFILAVSLGLGLGVEFVPDVVSSLPDLLKNLLSSGPTTGALAGILLNLLIPRQ